MIDWTQIKHFSPDEKWGDPDKMDPTLLRGLDQLRDFVGRPIIIHCGYEQRDSGYHPTGMAADLHIEGMHVVDQFLAAARFDVFNGIGFYLDWNNPGLHLDTRPKKHALDFDARWMRSEGIYKPIDKNTLKKALF